jgi:hypothetical protein
VVRVNVEASSVGTMSAKSVESVTAEKLKGWSQSGYVAYMEDIKLVFEIAADSGKDENSWL